jgi:dTDP-glucose 4,6-dehydratase
LAGNRILNLGNISPTRDLTFIQDTVEGFIEIAKKNKLTGEVTNIGSGFEISVKELALEIARICNVQVEFNLSAERKRPEKSEVERLYCDNTKIKKNTNWQPKNSLTQGIEQTVTWIKQNIHSYKHELYIK